MGCGNSLATKTSQGQAEESKEVANTRTEEEQAEEDDEKKINYGGVYVGIPTDPNAIVPVQIGSVAREAK